MFAAGNVTLPIWVMVLSITLVISLVSGLVVRYERHGKGILDALEASVGAVEKSVAKFENDLLRVQLEMAKDYLTKTEHDRTMERIDTKLGDLDKKLDNIRGSYHDQSQRRA